MNDINHQIPKSRGSRPFDLEERTAVFAESIISFLKRIEINPVNKRLIEQLVGSAGSIGANYCEANESESKKDFVHKMAIAKKEIKETKHWIRLLAKSEDNYRQNLREFWQEAQELLLIFSKIIHSSRNKNEN